MIVFVGVGEGVGLTIGVGDADGVGVSVATGETGVQALNARTAINDRTEITFAGIFFKSANPFSRLPPVSFARDF